MARAASACSARGARHPRWPAVAMLVAVTALLPAAAAAAGPVETYDFPNAELEDRYRALIDEFRCPKCLNTNLAGSDAPIAHDLRVTVHRLLVQEGRSDPEIRDFLQERYGDFVLYDPPFRPGTWLLWLGPLGFLVLGVWMLFRVLHKPEAPALDAADRARLASILGRSEPGGGPASQ